MSVPVYGLLVRRSYWQCNHSLCSTKQFSAGNQEAVKSRQENVLFHQMMIDRRFDPGRFRRCESERDVMRSDCPFSQGFCLGVGVGWLGVGGVVVRVVFCVVCCVLCVVQVR